MLKPFVNDAEMWTAIRSDNELAFTALFDKYWVQLYKTAKRYLKDHEISEEVVHDVFLNIWKRRHELEIASFPNFLLTAIRYQVYNRMRSAKSPVVLTLTGEESPVTDVFDLNTGENRIKDAELQQELSQYISQLPKRCQEIFYMSRVHRLSNQEIAEKLEISKRTVENQITIALKHLRACYKHIAILILLVGIVK